MRRPKVRRRVETLMENASPKRGTLYVTRHPPPRPSHAGIGASRPCKCIVDFLNTISVHPRLDLPLILTNIAHHGVKTRAQGLHDLWRQRKTSTNPHRSTTRAASSNSTNPYQKLTKTRYEYSTEATGTPPTAKMPPSSRKPSTRPLPSSGDSAAPQRASIRSP